MVYVRGRKNDHDRWSRMGNEGWDYDSLLPYYKKSENLQEPSLMKSNLHGKDGYLTTTRTLFNYPIRDLYIEAIKELGYNYYDDQPINDLGFYDSLLTVENGTRCSSSKAFLTKIKRKNLHLATDAFVKRIIIDKSTMRANGIVVSINGKDLTVNAKKEIILSAGSINSPQLLMLSDVGPKKHLNDLGVEVIKDLPVGENLKDHIYLPALFFHVSEHLTQIIDVNKDYYDYFMNRKGPLTSIGFANFMGFINTLNTSNNVEPDIQMLHISIDRRSKWELFLQNYGFVDEILRSDELKFPAIGFLPTLAKPKSTGRILLSTTNPYDKPLICPNYFGDEDDLETMLRSVKFITKLMETEPFKRHNFDLMRYNVPNCNQIPFKSDDYWRCLLRNMASTVFHISGTCKMGPEDDKTSVVNSKLQVHGIENLRVIDASIMPEIVSVNTNAPVMMIGEKGSDLIKNDWMDR